MNFFEILTAGNSSLTENHITAMIAWLFDPYHNHGLGTELLEKVVKTCFPGTPLESEILSKSSKGLLKQSDSKLTVYTELEVEVFNKGKARRVDIVMTIADRYVIALEHKIRSASVDLTQLEDEALGLKDCDGYGNKEIYMLYLTPDSSEATKCFASLSMEACTNKAHLLWTAKDSTVVTLVDILKNLLSEESMGSISPVSTELAFILKSLVNFAMNDFRVPSGIRTIQAGNTDYFDGYYYGFDEVQAAYQANHTVYIGLNKGEAELEKILLLAKDDEQKREWFLGRRFKWCSNNNKNGKNPSNWIPIKVFIEKCRNTVLLQAVY